MVGRCDPRTSTSDYSEYVRKLVDQAPPLTAQQRVDLSQILRPAAARREMAGTR